MTPEIKKRIDSWLNGPFDQKTKDEITHLLQKDPKALEAAFFKDLSFGTGGMRGLMGIGTNRLNIYTIRLATQGLSTYLNKLYKEPSVFIGYDTRHHSKEFAIEAAKTFAGNGIKVFIAKDITPTPLVSFACRHFKCQSAVMITASHNPPEYNGYKVYGEDGGQLVFPHDVGVMEEVKKTKDWKLSTPNSPLISWIGNELDDAYFEKLKTLQLYSGKNLKIVYSNLHGTGIRLTPHALKLWGFPPVTFVEEQKPLDGAFPYASFPNPEEISTLKLGMEKLLQEKHDLFLATDPDADRVGVVVCHQNKAVRLTGNQVAALLLHHILSSLQKKNQIPKNGACVKTIVTSEMFRKIGEKFGAYSVDVLTGFKFIAEKMNLWEKDQTHTYLFGAEESCGYLFGTFERDKDGISACCLIAEMAEMAKEKNKTLIDLLYDLYKEFGIYREMQKSIVLEDTEEGLKKVIQIMTHLRKNPPSQILGKKVVHIVDYLEGKNLPKSDVIELQLEDETKLIVRPSGTEPKIKIYGDAVSHSTDEIQTAILDCDQRLKKQVDALYTFLTQAN